MSRKGSATNTARIKHSLPTRNKMFQPLYKIRLNTAHSTKNFQLTNHRAFMMQFDRGNIRHLITKNENQLIEKKLNEYESFMKQK